MSTTPGAFQPRQFIRASFKMTSGSILIVATSPRATYRCSYQTVSVDYRGMRSPQPGQRHPQHPRRATTCAGVRSRSFTSPYIHATRDARMVRSPECPRIVVRAWSVVAYRRREHPTVSRTAFRSPILAGTDRGHCGVYPDRENLRRKRWMFSMTAATR